MQFRHNGGRTFHHAFNKDDYLYEEHRSNKMDLSKELLSVIWGDERTHALLVSLADRLPAIHKALATALDIPLLHRNKALAMVAQEHQLSTPIQLVYLDCACAVEDMALHKRDGASLNDSVNAAGILIQASHRAHVKRSKPMPERFVIKIYQILDKTFALS